MNQSSRLSLRGASYTKAAGRNHFAETGDEPVVVQITGFGPSSTGTLTRRKTHVRRKHN